jgi:uncharacterized protein
MAVKRPSTTGVSELWSAPVTEPARPYRLEVRRSLIDRRGCFAAEPIPAGASVAEYTGEVISAEEAIRREADPARQGVYTLWGNDDRAIDGLFGGNETIYMNHSCAPNCYPETVGRRIFIVAQRDIGAGEELTLDYEYDAAGPPEPCGCNAPECRGYINAIAP